jgi:DNA-binding MarR family transcriptional regulator
MKNKSLGFDAALSDEHLKNDADWIIRLGFLIHDVARLRRTVLDEVFKPLNITRSQAWALAYLSRSDELTQSELAEQMGLGKVALGGLIDRLEKGGMIVRRSHPTDRRINLIFLTDKGKKVIELMRGLTLESNTQILDGVSFNKLKQTALTLIKMKANLEKMKSNSSRREKAAS